MSTPTIHPDAVRLADYRAGRLTPAQTLAISDHLAVCPECRALLPGTSLGYDDVVREVPLPARLPDAPPDFEEMMALLDGSLDPDRAASVHDRLEASSESREAFEEVRRFHAQLAALPPKWHGPEVASAEDAPAPEAGLPAPGKVVAFPRLPRVWWAAAAAVVLLAGGSWLVKEVHRPATPALLIGTDLASLPPHLRQSVEQAARTGRIDMPLPPADLLPAAGSLAGQVPASSGFRQVAPVREIVREDRPVLRWVPQDGATGYRLYLADIQGRSPLMTVELPAEQTQWTPPAALPRGATFEWQVEALRGEQVVARTPRPPEPEARFQILDGPRATELDDLERRFRDNPLVLGTAYAHDGLTAAAAAQFDLLERRFPNSLEARQLHRWGTRFD